MLLFIILCYCFCCTLLTVVLFPLFDADGRLVNMAVPWKLLDSKRALELMLMFQKVHGHKLQVSTIF